MNLVYCFLYSDVDNHIHCVNNYAWCTPPYSQPLTEWLCRLGGCDIIKGAHNTSIHTNGCNDILPQVFQHVSVCHRSLASRLTSASYQQRGALSPWQLTSSPDLDHTQWLYTSVTLQAHTTRNFLRTQYTRISLQHQCDFGWNNCGSSLHMSPNPYLSLLAHLSSDHLAAATMVTFLM